MTTALESFRENFRLDQLQIAESEHWVWSVRPVQCTLGAGVLSVKEEYTKFSDLPSEAGSDLMNLVKRVETSLNSSFRYAKINYLMLMMVDPLVHFHVIPRYDGSVSMFDREWKDTGWPGPPDLAAPATDDEVLFQIREMLRKEN